MHAIKGGWAGQTFALAKGNDSERRKSRIRRSKEERKDMVESFIKKYQKSNDGNFPSLNLTHKEVGGSFYTVREIVREIIQENRVLGPAKLTPEVQNMVQLSEQYPLGSISTEPQVYMSSSEEQNMVQLYEQYPLGSISTEPQVHLSSSVETDFAPAPNHQIRSEELVLDSSRIYGGPENRMVDNVQIINGHHMEEKNEESGKNAEFEVAETSGAKNIILEEVEVTAARVMDIAADVVVETFPLRSVTKPSDSLDRELGEASGVTVILEEKEIEKVEIEMGKSSELDGKNSVEDLFVLVDEEAVTSMGGSLSGMNSGLLDEEAVKNVTDPLLESSSITSINEDVVHCNQDGTVLEVKTSHCDSLSSDAFEQSQEIAENKNLGSPNVFYIENIKGSSTSSSCGKTLPKETIGVEKKPNIQDGSSSPHKGSNPTLDRINLESWEGPSKKSTELETNPFLAFIKAFVSAFVKFWSE